MNRVRLHCAKTLLLLGTSAIAMLVAQAANAGGPLSEHVVGSGPTVNSTSPIPGIPGVVTTPQQVSGQQAQTTANLAQAAARLQAALTAQANARAAAQAVSSTVPNGLTPGGLQVDPRAVDTTNPNYNPLFWIGANQPTQANANGQTTVSITQTQSTALLNWQTFNVGKQTTVNFVQKNSQGTNQPTWVAVNKVNDPNALPSQILGSINAPGSVYVLNRNGILFGGSSQINVGNLVAAAADYIDPSLDNDPVAFQTAFNANGLYSPVAQVLGSYCGGGSGGNCGYDYSPVFVNAGGSVTVQAGAQISTNAPTSVTQGGGFALLMGSTVSNSGVIETPDGQAALAAGDSFFIRPGYSPGNNTGSIAENNTASTTRGNEIAYALNPNSASGAVTNAGLMQATTGDVTMVGQTVAQDGIAFATTSVSQRGTIHLLTSQEDPTSSVTLGSDSLTTVQPDLSSAAKALNSQRSTLISQSATDTAIRSSTTDPYLFEQVGTLSGGNGTVQFAEFDDLSQLPDRLDQSRIEVTTGGLAEFQNGSLTMAQGGQIPVSAVKRILVDSGANLDVSGSLNVLLPASANVLEVNVQGNELRDDPLNRDTKDLFNDNVYVDINSLTLVPAGTDGYETDRYYTAGGLLEVSGWLANVSHTIGEWTAAGGTITLSTGLAPNDANGRTALSYHNAGPVPASAFAGDIVVQPGSIFNLSGGSIDYQGGDVATTYLLGADGKTYNINTAPSDIVYTGLANTFQVDHSRWVTTDNYSTGLIGNGTAFAPAYIVGKDAGQLILNTPTSIFEGTIDSGVVVGANQNAARPAGVTDSYLLPQNVVPLPANVTIDTSANSNTLLLGAPEATSVLLGRDIASVASSISGAAALPQDRVNTAWFDASLLDNLGGVTIDTLGGVAINAPLMLTPGGALTVSAGTTDIAANITAHGGSVTITATPYIGSNSLAPGGVDITVEPNVSIDTTGLFVNAKLDSTDLAGGAFVNGGSIMLSATDGITLSSGSVIDTSAGGVYSANGKTTIGNGGNISLLADQADIASGGYFTNPTALLTLGGTLKSFGTIGGALTISTPEALLISDEPLPFGTTLPAGTAAPVPLTLSNSLTIAAGQALPLQYTYSITFSTINPGQPIPTTISAGNNGVGQIVLNADWTLPKGTQNIVLYDPNTGNYSQLYSAGQTIPAGSIIAYGIIPAGAIIPIAQPLSFSPISYSVTAPVGSTLSTDTTYTVGTTVPTGAILPQSVTVDPFLTLTPSFFRQGFSSYDVANLGNIDVAPGTTLDLAEPVYQVGAVTASSPTGTPAGNAFSLVTPPLYVSNPTTSTITQRKGASLTLTTAIAALQAKLTQVTTYDGAGSNPAPWPITVTSGNSYTLTLLAPWTIPNDTFYQTANSGGITAYAPGGSDATAVFFPAGSTIPAGYTITDDHGNALEGSDQYPNTAVPIPAIWTFATTTNYTPSVALSVGSGASISVDSGQSVTLSSPGQITVDGSITAHSGQIAILDTVPIEYGLGQAANGTDPTANGLSIWIGSGATLDVSAVAQTAINTAGQPFGIVQNAGSIVLGNEGPTPPNSKDLVGIQSTSAFVIIRPGAVLDADGASANIALFPSDSANPDIQTVASDGGSITLTSFNGIYTDGTLTARSGGAGAAGGTLSMTLTAPIYGSNVDFGAPSNIPGDLQEPRYLTVTQSAEPSGLPADLAAGTADPSFTIGQSTISVVQIEAGGFDSVDLEGGNGLSFNGNVNLSVGKSLTLASLGGISDTTDNAAVSLAAPYVLLKPGNFFSSDDYIFAPSGSPPIGNAASFNILAGPVNSQAQGSGGLIELGGQERFYGFTDVNLTSDGDIRFLPSVAIPSFYQSQLTASDNLSLTAERIYALPLFTVAYPYGGGGPSTYNGTYKITATDDLSIHNVGAAPDTATPYSMFSTFDLYGSTVEQGGAIFAPLGQINIIATSIDLQPGSLTSTSANGLLLPYGGSADGLSYTINGYPLPYASLASTALPGVTLSGNTQNYTNSTPISITVEKGAVVDVSGGGEFQGKSFVSGEGGSVDTLVNPSLTFNAKAGTYSTNASDQVYAIIAGAQPGYSPEGGNTIDGSPDPAAAVGQQITIPAGVPGLPAGTYTLLPSNFALLPGGYRVELEGNAASQLSGATKLANGSYLVDGTSGVANTSIESVRPTQIAITPGKTILDHSSYIQDTYTQTLENEIAQTGTDQINETSQTLTPSLLADAGSLNFLYPGTSSQTLSFQGTGIFTAGTGGTPGIAAVESSSVTLDIVGPSATPIAGDFAVNAADLSAIGAPTLVIANNGSAGINVLSGANLNGQTIVLYTASGQSAATIAVNGGASIDATSLLAFDAPSGTVDIAAGAHVASQGTLSFDTAVLAIDPGAEFGAKSLALASSAINIGTAGSLAAAGSNGTLPSGLSLTQDELNTLLAGNASANIPALQSLALAATGSLNLIGTVAFDTTSLKTLEIDTPAIYGAGTASDSASITAGTLIWNGDGSQSGQYSYQAGYAPAATQLPGGPGSGAGSLTVNASDIIMGSATPGTFYAPIGSVTIACCNGAVTIATTPTVIPGFGAQLESLADPRVITGFSSVNFTATNSIVSNSHGSLTANQDDGSPVALKFSTPLLTGAPGSVMRYSTSGALIVAPPQGASASSATPNSLGAEIDLVGQTINVNSTIVANSGKITLNATDDIALGASARLDLSGQPKAFNDVTEYSWGGDLSLLSADGNITQTAGSVIDVSAVNNAAGSLTVKAVGSGAGAVELDGTLLGSSTPTGGANRSYASGTAIVDAQTLNSDASTLSADFATLNASLDSGGFHASRQFDLKQGDLVIGDGVKASDVEVSLDGGSLTVNGIVDASGPTPGSIRLSAANNLTLASTGVLDAHGSVLQVDSYGNAIDAENRAHVWLTSTTGMLTLSGGATIDVSSPDTNPQGAVELNVSRMGETSGDANIVVSGPVTINGAGTIAVNAFWTYSPSDALGTIVQNNEDPNNAAVAAATGYLGLDQVNAISQSYMAKADASAALQAKLAGLIVYGSTFHFRPGVQIESNAATGGNLTVGTDLDLSGYRYSDPSGYGAQVDHSVYGSGEPGVIVFRAANNLNINGSITDGFAPPPYTPDDKAAYDLYLPAGTALPSNVTLSYGEDLAAGSAIPTGDTLGFAVTLQGFEPINLVSQIFDVLGQTVTLPDTIQWIPASNVSIFANTRNYLDPGTRYYGDGDFFAAASVSDIAAAGTTLTSSITIDAPFTLQAAWTIPAGATDTGIVFASPNGLTEQRYYAGQTVPTGWTATAKGGDDLLAGTYIDPKIFPYGIITTATFAGSHATDNGSTITIFAGTDIPVQDASLFPAGSITTVGTVPDLLFAANHAVPNMVTLTTTVSYTAPSQINLTGSETITEPGGTVFNNSTPVPTGTVLPVGTALSAGVTLPTDVAVNTVSWPANTPLTFDQASVALAADANLSPGALLPAGVTPSVTIAHANGHTNLYAIAPMLPQGDLSWSISLVSGADLSAADTHMLQTPSALAATGATGNMALNDPLTGLTVFTNYVSNCCTYTDQQFAVIRTGTGNLDLVVGGDFNEQTPFGIYTAGAQSADVGSNATNPLAGSTNAVTGVTQPDQVNEFDLPRPLQSDGSNSMLGDWYAAAGGPNNRNSYVYTHTSPDQAPEYEMAVADYRAYYPTGGGDVLLTAQGNINSVPSVDNGAFGVPQFTAVSNWLWRQGATSNGQGTAWWINFGTYVNPPEYQNPSGTGPAVEGFQGVGTLGGGNLTMTAGGNIEFLNAAVGSTGRVLSVATSGGIITGGTIDETGGGIAKIVAGGDVGGTLTDMRGPITVRSSTIGDFTFNVNANTISDTLSGNGSSGTPFGLVLVQGDAPAVVQARGEVMLVGEGDAGFAANTLGFSNATFSLWTTATSVDVASAGGDVAPAGASSGFGSSNVNLEFLPTNGGSGLNYLLAAPSSLTAIAYNGDLLFGTPNSFGSIATDGVELMPSADGELQLLASGSILGQGLLNPTNHPDASFGNLPDFVVAMSGADAGPNYIANPFRPDDSGSGTPFAFETDTPTSDLHAGDYTPNRIYALNGDIDSFGIDDMAKASNIEAAGNIFYLSGQLTNDKPNDVSLIQAGGNIIYPSVAIAGPGDLAVIAGGNIFMGNRPNFATFCCVSIFGLSDATSPISAFYSTGLWYGQNGGVTGGAGISVVAGVGSQGPDYSALASLYLNPANQADPNFPLDFPQNKGKVVQTYQDQLYAWLQNNYDYSGSEADEMTFFDALSVQQQDIFLRQAFFNELDQADVEFNDPSSKLFKSYVRGRTAIATLFPTTDASGNPITYSGDVTMNGGSGIRSEFGGDIDILTPGGATTIGVEGAVPPSTAGVITQGSGNVDIYSLGSVELGQSRVFTTFGGDITIWSAEGDINAGRGAKTTVVYSPPLLVYNDLGNITLSPTVPTQGAGIATLAPIPQVPPGNVYLVAPLGIIDAGEAGIRVSGNAFLAALHIVNAANIDVKGLAFGLPPKPVTNLSLTTASNAATEAANLVRNLNTRQQSVISVEVTGFGGSADQPEVCIPTASHPCQ